MSELLRLGDEKTNRLPIIQVLAIDLPIQISGNIAVDIGVAKGSMGRIVGFEFEQSVKFEPIEFGSVTMNLASDLPIVAYVDISSIRLNSRLQVVPEYYSTTTSPLIPVTENVDIHLPNGIFSLTIS